MMSPNTWLFVVIRQFTEIALISSMACYLLGRCGIEEVQPWLTREKNEGSAYTIKTDKIIEIDVASKNT